MPNLTTHEENELRKQRMEVAGKAKYKDREFTIEVNGTTISSANPRTLFQRYSLAKTEYQLPMFNRG